jgi:hypothetical protein
VANARFAYWGLPPPSPYKQIDTKQISSKHFNLPSYKLEYLAKFFNLPFKKLTKRHFEGMDLWTECMAGNNRAWGEMRRYNCRDVITMKYLYKKIAPWGTGINFNVYRASLDIRCNCGSSNFIGRGTYETKTASYRRFRCKDCGHWFKDESVNLLSKEKILSLKKIR